MLPHKLVRRFIVLMPTRGLVCTETLTALQSNTEGHQLTFLSEDRQDVDVARNVLAARSCEVKLTDNQGFPDIDPYVLWLDSDAYFMNGTLTMMMRTLENNPWIELLVPFSGPRAALAKTNNLNMQNIAVEPGINCEENALIELNYASSHCMMHRRSLLRRLGSNPFGTANNLSLCDDYHFSQTIRDAGGRIAMNSAIPVFHIDPRNGNAYLPAVPAMRIVNNQVTFFEEDPLEDLPYEKRSYGKRIDTVTGVIEAIAKTEGSA